MSKVLVMALFIWSIGINPLLGQKSSSSDSVGRQIAMTYPVIGKAVPSFKLRDIQYYSSASISPNELKGKYVILDFFSTGCVACFASFPKLNELQRDYKGKVEFILVGRDDQYIRPIYERYRQRQKLDLAVAYDTLLFTKFRISGVPYVVFIDRQGIVKAVTGHVTREMVDAFINDKPFEYIDRSYKKGSSDASSADLFKPLLVDGNLGTDTAFLFRSLLTKWRKGIDPVEETVGGFHDVLTPGSISSFFPDKDGIQLIGVDLNILYLLAYSGSTGWNQPFDSLYGIFWNKPLLDVVDHSKFESVINGGNTTGENMYSYSLYVPSEKATELYLKQVMQRDLKNYFGYDVVIERRKMPCLNLIASQKAHRDLKTRHPNFKRKQGLYGVDLPPIHAGLNVINWPVKSLLGIIATYQSFSEPLIDQTGIKNNIDINLEGVAMADFEDVKRALQKNGLDLVRSEQEMNVIVIRDLKPENNLK